MPNPSVSESPATNPQVRTFLKAIRVRVFPPRNAAFIKGRPHAVEPMIAGPTGAVYDGKAMPAWWLLKCGRLAEFVGIHDGSEVRGLRSLVGEAETIIDGNGIYRISENPLSQAERQALHEAA